MNYFRLIAQDVPIEWLRNELAAKPELWNQHTLRTANPASPHQQVDDILLRFNRIPDRIEDWDELESINYPALEQLPEAGNLMHWLMARVEGERLGRVMITRLKPGARIAQHRDLEVHAGYYDRFHIVLQADHGSVFTCADEQVVMRRGECWAFDNAAEHYVENVGAIDRIHLIVDIRTAKPIFPKESYAI